jgi:hypothetical protein
MRQPYAPFFFLFVLPLYAYVSFIYSPSPAPSRPPLLYKTRQLKSNSAHVYKTALLLVKEGVNSNQKVSLFPPLP